MIHLVLQHKLIFILLTTIFRHSYQLTIPTIIGSTCSTFRPDQQTTRTLLAFSSGNSAGEEKSSKPSKYVSLSDQERRDEEGRRLQRKHDVDIGKTSAISGAKDYKINPKATEEDLLSNILADNEREVWAKTEEGLQFLKMLELEKSYTAFERVYQLKPNAYVYQYGIVLFYLGHIHEAAKIFAQNAVHYESHFFEPASEERIWRDACELKLLGKVGGKPSKAISKEWIPQIPETEEILDEAGNVLVSVGEKVEMRKVIRTARDLFRASVENDMCTMILSRAKLRSICGKGSPSSSKKSRVRPDWKMWKFNSWYYLGLHFDALAKTEESKACMKMALVQNVGGMNTDDVTKCLPLIHMSKRDWFDDDEFNDDLNLDDANGILGWNLEGIIESGVKDMKLAQLQNALRLRGLKTSGSKSLLQDRVLEFMISEAKYGDDKFII